MKKHIYKKGITFALCAITLAVAFSGCDNGNNSTNSSGTDGLVPYDRTIESYEALQAGLVLDSYKTFVVTKPVYWDYHADDSRPSNIVNITEGKSVTIAAGAMIGNREALDDTSRGPNGGANYSQRDDAVYVIIRPGAALLVDKAWKGSARWIRPKTTVIVRPGAKLIGISDFRDLGGSIIVFPGGQLLSGEVTVENQRGFAGAAGETAEILEVESTGDKQLDLSRYLAIGPGGCFNVGNPKSTIAGIEGGNPLGENSEENFDQFQSIYNYQYSPKGQTLNLKQEKIGAARSCRVTIKEPVKFGIVRWWNEAEGGSAPVNTLPDEQSVLPEDGIALKARVNRDKALELSGIVITEGKLPKWLDTDGGNAHLILPNAVVKGKIDDSQLGANVRAGSLLRTELDEGAVVKTGSTLTISGKPFYNSKYILEDGASIAVENGSYIVSNKADWNGTDTINAGGLFFSDNFKITAPAKGKVTVTFYGDYSCADPDNTDTPWHYSNAHYNKNAELLVRIDSANKEETIVNGKVTAADFDGLFDAGTAIVPGAASDERWCKILPPKNGTLNLTTKTYSFSNVNFNKHGNYSPVEIELKYNHADFSLPGKPLDFRLAQGTLDVNVKGSFEVSSGQDKVSFANVKYCLDEYESKIRSQSLPAERLVSAEDVVWPNIGDKLNVYLYLFCYPDEPLIFGGAGKIAAEGKYAAVSFKYGGADLYNNFELTTVAPTKSKIAETELVDFEIAKALTFDTAALSGNDPMTLPQAGTLTLKSSGSLGKQISPLKTVPNARIEQKGTIVVTKPLTLETTINLEYGVLKLEGDGTALTIAAPDGRLKVGKQTGFDFTTAQTTGPFQYSAPPTITFAAGGANETAVLELGDERYTFKSSTASNAAAPEIPGTVVIGNDTLKIGTNASFVQDGPTPARNIAASGKLVTAALIKFGSKTLIQAKGGLDLPCGGLNLGDIQGDMNYPYLFALGGNTTSEAVKVKLGADLDATYLPSATFTLASNTAGFLNKAPSKFSSQKAVDIVGSGKAVNYIYWGSSASADSIISAYGAIACVTAWGEINSVTIEDYNNNKGAKATDNTTPYRTYVWFDQAPDGDRSGKDGALHGWIYR